jgi:hypothetical protein
VRAPYGVDSPPYNCELGKKHKNDQKKDRNKANSAVIAPAATTTISPCYKALLATLANLDEEERWFAPACIWNVALACMAGPLDTGHQILTYLFIQFLPIIIFILCFLAYPTNDLATTILRWHLGASRGTLALFDVKESRNTRNLLESCKTKPKAKRF